MTPSVTKLSQQSSRYEAIRNIPDFGSMVTAVLISAVGTGNQFPNGHQFSAWSGLVPKQNSTGGKSSLGSLSKKSNRELRALLIHGARAVVRCGASKADTMGAWLRGLIARRGKVKAIVVFANKLGRVAWHILAKIVNTILIRPLSLFD